MTIIENILRNSAVKKQKFIPLFSLLKKRRLHKQIKLYTPFGQTVDGQLLFLDFRELGSLLVAGADNSGKTTFLKSIMATLMLKGMGKGLEFIIATPKSSDYVLFNKTAHLLPPIITEAEKLTQKIESLVAEMDSRYKTLTEAGQLTIQAYNWQNKPPMPHIFVIVDDFSDIIENAPQSTMGSLEKALISLLQLGRAVGIYIILATKNIDKKFIPEMVKANFFNRVSFRTATKKDSKGILYCSGAEKLLGKGDGIITHFGDGGVMVRIQTPFITDKELTKIIKK